MDIQFLSPLPSRVGVIAVYWYWYATWVYRYYYCDNDWYWMNLEGVLQLIFICLAPTIVYNFSDTSKNSRYWFKLGIGVAITRSISYVLAYSDLWKAYGVFFVISLFSLVTYMVLTKMFNLQNEKVWNEYGL